MVPARGFTLIELLVVLGIIGLLIAIELPKINDARINARESQVKSNLNTIQKALERYATDNGALYPPWLYGGDVSDSYTVTQSTFELMVKDKKALKTKQEPFVSPYTWMNNAFAQPGDGDSLIQYGYLYFYPKNPFVPRKNKPDTPENSLATFKHTSLEQESWRNVAGIYNNRMWEISGGPPQIGIRNHFGSQYIQPAEFVDPTRTMAPVPKNPQIFAHLTGNFYYYSLLQNVSSWGQYHQKSTDDKGNPVTEPVFVNGYRLVGYGSVLINKGEDLYDNMGDFNEHARCGRFAPDAQPFNPAAGGSDGFKDGVILQLTSKTLSINDNND